MFISKRISKINPSPTLSITAKANKMKAEGINVIGFGAGEPDFDTPVHIKEAAKRAIDKGFTKYTPTSGTKELKDAIIKKFKDDNGLEYPAGEILVSCGAKHSIFNMILTLCGDGDDVIIPSPYWVSYPEMVMVSGATPVIVKAEAGADFKISASQLEKAITPRTKLVIINSPSNPTGMIYTKDELKRLSDVIVKAGIWCISDEIYEKLIYGGDKHVSIASFGADIKSRTIVVNGVSKAYSMTGWRIGYAAGPKEVIQAASNLQDHSTSNPVSISQAASVEALLGSQEDLGKMAVEFEKRRDYMVKRINSINGLSTVNPQGAFYSFVNISGLKGRNCSGKTIDGSFSLTDLLLTEARIAVVPGAVFGDDDHVRLSYATGMDNIVEGLNRFEDFIKKLS